jgi:peptide/nickel transport system ATP-binding protein
MSKLLAVRGLRIEARDSDGRWTEIVKDLDIDLDRGEVLGLVGESGAGKSMTGLAIMGYARDGTRIASGEIRFDGIEMRGATEPQIRSVRGARIAYVAQSALSSFNPAHRIISQYAEVPVLRRFRTRQQAYADAVELYARMRLPEPEAIGRRYPHQLSGGQLQRAMTAMAMACRPDLIIFDEPTTALDVTTQVEVLAAIKEVVRVHNTAAIFISHDLAVVAQMADRVMVLRAGSLVECADTLTILQAPSRDYTKSLWAVRNARKPETPAAPEQPPVLSISQLSARYRHGGDVLKDVSLEVGRQRTVAVVGESGSGKSTLARVITGILPPRKGTIRLHGRELPPALKMRSRADLRNIQMIYQTADTALNPRQTIGTILTRPLKLHLGLNSADATGGIGDLLEMVELPSTFASRYPGELSGGQKQRVAIARALAAEPQLIICDEITSGLDQLVAENILKLLLRRLKDLGLSYLFITHDLSAVDAIADDVVVMCQGRVVDQGLRSMVLAPPRHRYTAELLASVPGMNPDWLDNLLAARDGQQSPGSGQDTVQTFQQGRGDAIEVE